MSFNQRLSDAMKGNSNAAKKKVARWVDPVKTSLGLKPKISAKKVLAIGVAGGVGGNAVTGAALMGGMAQRIRGLGGPALSKHLGKKFVVDAALQGAGQMVRAGAKQNLATAGMAAGMTAIINKANRKRSVAGKLDAVKTTVNKTVKRLRGK